MLTIVPTPCACARFWSDSHQDPSGTARLASRTGRSIVASRNDTRDFACGTAARSEKRPRRKESQRPSFKRRRQTRQMARLAKVPPQQGRRGRRPRGNSRRSAPLRIRVIRGVCRKKLQALRSSLGRLVAACPRSCSWWRRPSSQRCQRAAPSGSTGPRERVAGGWSWRSAC